MWRGFVPYGEFSIEVFDEQMPDNQGPWRVRFSSARVEIEKCDDAAIRMPIGHFSQAFMGEPSLASLARMGLVEVRSECELKQAFKLLTPMPVFCTEFF